MIRIIARSALSSDESIELRWFKREEAESLEVDDSVRILLRIAFERPF